jgi:putative aldouronate transport system permease protein
MPIMMPKKRKALSVIRQEYPLYVLIIPAVVATFVFSYMPMFINVIAFMDYDLFAGWLGLGSKFVGFKWFRQFLGDPFFYQVAWRTLYYSVVQLVVGFPAPIILALLLNELRQQAFKRTVQTISYLPYFVSWVTVAGIIYLFLGTSSTGLINNVLGLFGIPRTTWMAYGRNFLPIITISGIWKGVGWGSIIYIAAIASIDQEMYDAAKIDGASRWQQMRYITLPGIMPATMILLILACGGLFSANFDQLYTMANDVIRSETYVINVYSYFTGIWFRKYSLGTAINLFQGLINFILVLSANFIVKRVRGHGLF